MKNIILSTLPHTWLFDLDGTLCVHNGYKKGVDIILPNVVDFIKSIPKDDLIIILTSRKKIEKSTTLTFLKKNDIRYDHIIFDLPFGERVIINDKKPSGLSTALAINIDRDNGLSDLNLFIDKNL